MSGRVIIDALHGVSGYYLLEPDSVFPNKALLQANTASKVVMITGEGGFISPELCRQILKQRPRKNYKNCKDGAF